MFDIGWSEMAVIALLTLIVIGPKELPRVLRTVGQWVRKAQSLAREFQRGLDDMAREADLEDAKKLVDAGRSIANPKKMVMDTLDPTGSVEDAAKDLRTAMTAEAPGGEAPGGEASASEALAQESADKTAAKGTASKPSGNGTPTPAKSTKSKPKAGAKSAAKAKPKSRAKPKAKPAPKTESAAAGSHGSQKTA